MKIELKYTRSGVQRSIYLETLSTDIKVDLSALAILGGRANYTGYAWSTISDKDYLSKNPAVGDSYITTADYSNLASAETIAKTDALRAAINGLSFDMGNAFVFGVNPEMQFVDTSVISPTESAGEEMQLGSGTCKLCAFTQTEYPGGTPTSVSYLGGISAIKPSGGTGLITYARSMHAEYNTATAPAVALFEMTIHDDTTSAHAGEDIPCILILMRCGANIKSTIVSKNAFDGAGAKPKQGDGLRNVTPYGRTGTYNFDSDKMTDVAPTGYSFINRWDHGLTLFHLNDYQAEALFNEFWGNDTLYQRWLNSVVKPVQGVICMHKLPFSVASGSRTKPMTIFGKRIVSGQLLDAVPIVNEQIIKIPSSPQWVPIEEIYGDFFDYAGESKLSVYLPFIGTVPIDVNKIMNGAIMTVYYFDVLTGNCIARVYGRNGMQNGAEVLLYQGCGNAALSIPYVGNDQGGMKQLGAVAGIATAGLATLATGGAAAAPAMAAITGASQSLLAEKNESVNSIPTECSPLTYPYVCYIQTYPERTLADLQRSLSGWASASGKEGTTVNSYTGFVQGVFHAEIDGATDAEKAAIEDSFRNGVIV